MPSQRLIQEKFLISVRICGQENRKREKTHNPEEVVHSGRALVTVQALERLQLEQLFNTSSSTQCPFGQSLK